MSWRHVIEMSDLLDSPSASGKAVAEVLKSLGATEVEVTEVTGEAGETEFVKVLIPGTNGRSSGGDAPTLGIIGRLGGLGARPEQIGFVSDGDGALVALSAAAKLLDAAAKGDRLPGDVIVSTHVDPDAPTQPHDPVPFMGSSVDMAVTNSVEVSAEMDAIVSVDTTRGNRICNHRGFAITPTIKEGWILRVSESLLDIVERTSGQNPVVLPITTQDITPYGNDVYHVNSIVQPTTATPAPVVGVALTTVTAVPGSATGASDLQVVESAVRFVVETAKDYGRGIASFYDPAEFERLTSLYGSLAHLQTKGDES
ncbi:DUF1177 domain-containing protein [Actinosynnema mirum]|uniref:DUF1177 domain-containing protein n=1 Tax=Actinosynnema mirum (strain ATCC 29888 / DSM 43827 / JCM 3225 / NBRC 14064 / NCIMB 13271 / NRRL B-12336 / IMRU 3971 / 101) TaxID=446462 RepID=C6WHA4_ACTMD|nr:DUF1177 domain-containing protein [Actinosynnema mirum]ACU38023.1 protein of unknown function DUF1177 [Actinosynnema mirum DSM 43827]